MQSHVIKFTIIILSGLLTQSTYAQTVSLSYKKAMELARTNHPEILSADAKYRRNAAIARKEGRFLTQAPEVEISVTRGSSKEAVDITGLPNTALSQGQDRDVSSMEAGISQKIDIAGQNVLRSESAETGLMQNRLEREKTQQLILSEVRQNYLTGASIDEWLEHLNSHIYRLRVLQRRTGGNYTDKRLGRYGAVALNSGIASLVSHRIEMTGQRNRIHRELKIATGIEMDREIKLDQTTGKLPDIPAVARLLAFAKDNSYETRIERAKLIRKQNERKLASRRLIPSPEFFVYGGRETIGTEDQFTIVNAEKQSYVRFGMRLPLDFLGPASDDTEIAAEENKVQEIRLEQIEKNLESYIRIEAETYNNEVKRYKTLHAASEQMERFMPLLENAMLTRRISFFEFWGEHERYHQMVLDMIQARINAYRSLTQLEILTGMDLDNSGIWSENKGEGET